MKNATMTLKRSTVTLVVIAVLAALLPACGGKEAPITVPAGAQAGDLVDLEPCTFTLLDEEHAADCGTLIVPENRSDPNTRLIALPVIRLKAASDTPTEPVFWLAGGPGHDNIIHYPLDGLTENHDFVMVGYRGIEGQVVLECPEVSKAIRNAPGTVLSPESLAAYTAGAAQCAERLESEGIDLAGYTLTETIDDVEAAREALGYDKINLYGNSYGARLQQIYMWRYPESLNRVIMVSVNPPGHFIWDPAVTDAQITDYAELCAKDAACSARTDDLVATMRKVSENMPDRWMGIAIDKEAIQLLTYFMCVESIQPDAPVPLSGPAAVDLWLDAAEGDYSGMAMIPLSKNLFLPTLFTWGHFLSMGVSSGDYRDASLDFEAAYNPPDALIGAPLSRFLYGIIEGWPAHTIDEAYFEVQPSDVETLLVSGSIDFSTPPQFATEELLPYLTNAEQVILEDMGHTESIWNSQPEARAHLVTTFFDTGEVDASLYQYQPIDFTVDRGWSDLMRIFIITISIVIAFIIALIWFTIYLVRRRKARKNQRLPDNRMKNPDVQQHTLLKSFGLHVLPGALTTAAFVALKPLLDPGGYPPLLAFLLAVTLVDLPLLLGVMLAAGKRRNGRYSLQGVVLYRDKVSWMTFALVFVGAFVTVYVLTMLVGPISTVLAEGAFSWLPDWMFLEERTQYQAYAGNALAVTFVLQLVVTGLALPWVEELYFRGYLLPRLSRYGKWAPFLGGLFFALYHVWQLFSFPTLFLLGTALAVVVWWKRDIRISIGLHVFANALTRLMFLLAALAM